MEDNTKFKILFERLAELQDEEVPEDERLISDTICECMSCHWIFTGDCARFGHGYTSESVQTPNYCPMCGSKLDELLAE